jgi:NTP pyrophosphatase (non-canonical NTP hydrolase)
VNISKLAKKIHERVQTIGVYPTEQGRRLELNAIALGNESGEVLGELKKWSWFFELSPNKAEEFLPRIKSELADVLYHLVEMCTVMELTIEDLADITSTQMDSKIGKSLEEMSHISVQQEVRLLKEDLQEPSKLELGDTVRATVYKVTPTGNFYQEVEGRVVFLKPDVVYVRTEIGEVHLAEPDSVEKL